ncbi:MAG TPA: glycosyltransferase family 4 protein [Candidatus Limnocylindria bacterium]|nr:glycosyltransferase family 4 protein [Candidatus Limnocylindria bacterium]
MTPLRSPAPDHEGAIASAPYRRHRRIHRSRSHPRPRVLQLLATGGTGGAQESYTGLLLRLDRSAYEVRALSLSSGSAVQRLRRLGLEVEVIDEADDEAAVRELTAYLVRNEIDLLHAHMYRAEVVGARASVAAGTAVVMATVHSSRVRSAEDIATLAALTPVMDRLLVPSASIVAKVRAEGRGAASFSVIPNGVDLARFDLPPGACALRREFGIPDGAPLLGVVARLEPEKGHRYLIEAMPAILRGAPETWLVIVGEGSLDAELRSLASALPAPARDSVIFTGRREDVAAITAEIDVAVLPSLREAQGISILEAMARRKPVVASAVGGIPEVLTNGIDGLLVPPADPAALADACIRLACSPELRARMGEAGRATVEARFSLDAMVRQIEEVYDEELVRAGALPPERAPSRSGGAQPVGRAALEIPPL